ncbi:MAG: hypothetical protein AAFV33_09525 [Chloroflexota bacterium]
MSLWKFAIIVMLVPVLAACGATSQPIAQVTALPTSESVASVPTATATLAPTETEAVGATDIEADDTTDATTAPATPTPASRGLAPGESRAIAMATDMVMQREVENLIEFDRFPVSMSFGEFYDGYSMRGGLILSDKLLSLDGQQVVMDGYMAPPLKPALDWFVLTRVPLALCPFCSTDADWPSDIALVYMPVDETAVVTTDPIRVTGQMEIGSSEDADTGMISLVRIYAEAFETISN